MVDIRWSWLPVLLNFTKKRLIANFHCQKWDMVAIPDFAAGAMENWGLITYRVVDILYDEKTSGASTKERIAEVVSARTCPPMVW